MTSAGIDRILCPTDFSALSGQALRHAVALARAFHSRLRVIHVASNPAPGAESVHDGTPWVFTPEQRRGVEEQMRRFLEPARKARVYHETLVREGDPWREIERAASEMEADLVVLGTHGRGGVGSLVLGAVAEKAVRRASCPVFTVSREEARTWVAPGLVTRILCATDFSPMSAEALRLSVRFAEKHLASILLLHVVENVSGLKPAAHRPPLDQDRPGRDLEGRATERLRMIVADARAPQVGVETRVVMGCAHKEILRIATEERADLIVVGAQSYDVVEPLLSGSNARRVVRGATCPVLIARPLEARVESHDPTLVGLALASTP